MEKLKKTKNSNKHLPTDFLKEAIKRVAKEKGVKKSEEDDLPEHKLKDIDKWL